MKNVINEEKYISIRNQELLYFQDKFKTDEKDEIASPSAKYLLTIEHYSHIEEQRHIHFSQGTVTAQNNNSIITVVMRNYDPFLFQWIQLKGMEYLLCGIDYQGYTIIDLQTGQSESFIPEDVYSGHGFCWAAIYHQTDSKILIVDGCYWACPYELVVYDISEPMILPFKELTRISDFHDVKGWASSNLFEYYDEDLNVKTIKA